MKFFTRALLIAGLVTGSSVLSAAEKISPAGVVTSVLGSVNYYKMGSSSAGKMRIGQQVYAGDRVKTNNNGRAVLVLSDGTQLKVNYQTDITLQGTNAKGEETERGISSVKILVGRLWARVSKKASKFEFITPAAVAAVKGTEPEFEVDPNGDTCISLWGGALSISNPLGDLEMGKMTAACIKKGFAPPKTTTALSGDSDFDAFSDAGEVVIDVNDVKGNARKVRIQYVK